LLLLSVVLQQRFPYIFDDDLKYTYIFLTISVSVVLLFAR